jgi:hypothetical protein
VPGELRRRCRGHAVAVQVVAAVAPLESSQGIAVSADRVGDGAGEVGGVEAEPVGDAQHLPVDLVGGKGRDLPGGVAGGAELPFDPVQPVGPAGQPLVDDEVRQRVVARSRPSRSAPGPRCWARAAGSCPSGRVAVVGQAPVAASSW